MKGQQHKLFSYLDIVENLRFEILNACSKHSEAKHETKESSTEKVLELVDELETAFESKIAGMKQLEEELEMENIKYRNDAFELKNEVEEEKIKRGLTEIKLQKELTHLREEKAIAVRETTKKAEDLTKEMNYYKNLCKKIESLHKNRLSELQKEIEKASNSLQSPQNTGNLKLLLCRIAFFQQNDDISTLQNQEIVQEHTNKSTRKSSINNHERMFDELLNESSHSSYSHGRDDSNMYQNRQLQLLQMHSNSKSKRKDTMASLAASDTASVNQAFMQSHLSLSSLEESEKKKQEELTKFNDLTITQREQLVLSLLGELNEERDSGLNDVKMEDLMKSFSDESTHRKLDIKEYIHTDQPSLHFSKEMEQFELEGKKEKKEDPKFNLSPIPAEKDGEDGNIIGKIQQLAKNYEDVSIEKIENDRSPKHSARSNRSFSDDSMLEHLELLRNENKHTHEDQLRRQVNSLGTKQERIISPVSIEVIPSISIKPKLVQQLGPTSPAQSSGARPQPKAQITPLSIKPNLTLLDSPEIDKSMVDYNHFRRPHSSQHSRAIELKNQSIIKNTITPHPPSNPKSPMNFERRSSLNGKENIKRPSMFGKRRKTPSPAIDGRGIISSYYSSIPQGKPQLVQHSDMKTKEWVELAESIIEGKLNKERGRSDDVSKSQVMQGQQQSKANPKNKKLIDLQKVYLQQKEINKNVLLEEGVPNQSLNASSYADGKGHIKVYMHHDGAKSAKNGNKIKVRLATRQSHTKDHSTLDSSVIKSNPFVVAVGEQMPTQNEKATSAAQTNSDKHSQSFEYYEKTRETHKPKATDKSLMGFKNPFNNEYFQSGHNYNIQNKITITTPQFIIKNVYQGIKVKKREKTSSSCNNSFLAKEDFEVASPSPHPENSHMRASMRNKH